MGGHYLYLKLWAIIINAKQWHRPLDPNAIPKILSIYQATTLLGSLLPDQTKHAISHLEALFSPKKPRRPGFIVSQQLGLNAFHFDVAELCKSYEEFQSITDRTTPSKLPNAPLVLIL